MYNLKYNLIILDNKMNKQALISRLGLGTYGFGLDESKKSNEIEVIRTAYSIYNIRLFDTAEMYSNGVAEKVLGEAIKIYERSSYILIGKILPENVVNKNVRKSCLDSLKRLNSNYFDVYLLHWRANVNLEYFVDEMESLKKEGLIKEWGVSNFDVSDMKDLFNVKNGKKCFLNQCLYNVINRGVEFDLIPWCKENNVIFMAYSPLCNSFDRRKLIYNNTELMNLSKKLGRSIETIMLSFVNRNNDIIAVFKTANLKHLKDNVDSISYELSVSDLETIDKYFPGPIKKIPLQKI